jgi:hypothetical protein
MAVAEVDFVLIDSSNGALTRQGGPMTPDVLSQIAAACQIQLNRDLAAYYPGSIRVRAGANAGDILSGEYVFALLATLPGVPEAIAYHDVNGRGVPVLYDAISLSDTLTGPGNSVSVAISHELCETVVDAGCNVWVDDGVQEHAQEACDAVEAQSYWIDNTGVAVSNFVLPAFWVTNHAGPYDFMSTIGPNPAAPTRPFETCAGGYQIVRNSGTNETQIQARALGSPVLTVGVSIPFAMRRGWRHGSRRARRGVPLAA